MAKLTTKGRKSLKSSDFALPIHNINHARAALYALSRNWGVSYWNNWLSQNTMKTRTIESQSIYVPANLIIENAEKLKKLIQKGEISKCALMKVTAQKIST